MGASASSGEARHRCSDSIHKASVASHRHNAQMAEEQECGRISYIAID